MGVDEDKIKILIESIISIITLEIAQYLTKTRSILFTVANYSARYLTIDTQSCYRQTHYTLLLLHYPSNVQNHK